MADDAVRAAQSLFEALAESAPDAIITIDGESIILSANNAVRRVFGHAPDELIGSSMTVLMPERMRAQHHRGIARFLATGTRNIPWTGVQLTGLTKDQREIPIEISFGEFVDASGRRVFSGFVRDISDRVLQQRELESVLENLRFQAHLLASVEQAIVSTDISGQVLSWNEHAGMLYGWKPGEAVGQNLSALIPSVEESEAADDATRRLHNGEKVAYERQVRRRDGEAIWIAVIAAPIRDAEGRVTRIVAMSTDISERRRLEAQSLQAQKMEALGRLAGGIAHDFNNLLTVINAHAEFLLPKLLPESEAAADVLQITKASTSAAALTRQLLTFSRHQHLEQQPVSVNAVITDLERMLSRLIGDHLDLAVDLASDAPVVLADAGLLEQAIVNLVVNARDAMSRGGMIRVTTRREMLSEKQPRPTGDIPPGAYAAISVADTGHGMSSHVRAKIFEPFFTTKGPGKGTGLGLATVYAIVKQFRGFIDVESVVGQGTTFTIHLPETARPVAEVKAIETAPVSRGSETILLVEDQAEVRAVAARILARGGYRVIEARNGAEALDVLENLRQPVDLVLTDAVMPQLSGPDLMRAVRANWPNLPFVIMSGYTNEALTHDDTADERTLFIQKPFESRRLLSTVRASIAKVRDDAAERTATMIQAADSA